MKILLYKFKAVFDKMHLMFQVQQRDIPGINAAYLAMDTEEGVEVVWNEVLFSERKTFKYQEVCFFGFLFLCNNFSICLVSNNLN